MPLIVCWNVNSIKMRLEHLAQLVNKHSPDVILLQETKTMNEAFPKMEVEDLGYNIAIHGQKTFNGVAILSRSPLEDVETNEGEARYIEAFTNIKGVGLRVASVYVPNGQEVGSTKFQSKMEFYQMLEKKLDKLLEFNENLVIGGDFNVAPEAIDVYNHKGLYGTIGHHQNEIDWFRTYLDQGFSDTFRRCNPDKQEFSWWDYRSGAFQHNKGMRIDHIITSPQASDLLSDAGIYSEFRALPKASDHAPIYCKFKESSK